MTCATTSSTGRRAIRALRVGPAKRRLLPAHFQGDTWVVVDGPNPLREARALWQRTLALLLFAAIVLWRPASTHVRAASVLSRLADVRSEGLLAHIAVHPIAVRDAGIPGIRARIYAPTDLEAAPGIVVVHGVHYLGIDEPRLQRFATTIAASGVVVLTPEVKHLCDYRIDPDSVDAIGSAASAFSARLGGVRVGVMGLSFAGGLSLIAAADPRFARSFAFVVAVGAHDDLRRVLHFFTSDVAARPDGTALRLRAHDYGPVVLVYSHVEDFFPLADVPVAADALRLWLHEDFDAARASAAALSPEAGAKMSRVFAHDVGALAPELDAEIARLGPQLAAVSPNTYLPRVRVPVFLLHGAGDTVIPSSETEWLARDAPRGIVRDVLVSSAIEHVGLQGRAAAWDQLELVHFMSDVLEATDETRAALAASPGGALWARRLPGPTDRGLAW